MRPSLILFLGLLAGLAPLSRAGDEPDPEAAHGELRADLPESLRDKLIDPLTVERRPTFAEGEHLVYKLGWSFFTVARAVLEVNPIELGEAPALELSVRTRTNSFADAFYKVRNLSTSWVAADVSRSLRYTALQKEGGRERDTVASFNPAASTVQYENRLNGEVREPVPILPGTFDPVGIVFFVRSLDFDVGDELVIPTTNGKEFFFTVVRVVERVKRKFALGRYEAFVLEPDIKDLGGVFKRSPDGKVRFFFSADERKLPLRMESEVAVGSFWAELTEIVE